MKINNFCDNRIFGPTEIKPKEYTLGKTWDELKDCIIDSDFDGKQLEEACLDSCVVEIKQHIQYSLTTDESGLYPYRDVFSDCLRNSMDYKNRDRKGFEIEEAKIETLKRVLGSAYISKFNYLMSEASAYGRRFLRDDVGFDPRGESYGMAYSDSWERFMHNNKGDYDEIYAFLTELDHRENRKTYSEVYYKK